MELLLHSPPVVAVAVRSDSALYSESWDLITERFDLLSRHRQMAFMTASEAAAHYERGRAAPASPSPAAA